MIESWKTMRQDEIHRRCWDLLPWFVNGTLPSEQTVSVEQHVSECAECASELRAHRNLHAQMRDGDAVTMAPQSAWQKMAERLDREEEALVDRYAKQTSVPIGRMRGRHAYASSPWTWAVAAQTLIIVGLGTAMWQQSRNTMMSPRYETLTSQTDMSARHGDLRVVFRRDISLADVNGLLRDLTAQIVAGPSEAGVFTLVVSPAVQTTGDAAQNPVSQTLQRLRADTRVVFAEPMIQPAESSAQSTAGERRQ